MVKRTPVAAINWCQCLDRMAGFWSSATARREVRRFLTLLSNPVKASHALTCHTQGHIFRTEESSFKQQFKIYSDLYFFYFEQDIEILKCLISLHSLLLLYIPVGLMYKFTLTLLLFTVSLQYYAKENYGHGYNSTVSIYSIATYNTSIYFLWRS